MYERFGKRLFDLVLTLPGLLVLSPLLLALAVAVRFDLGRPVLFRQPRAGLRGRRFNILKFSTMTNATDADGNLLPDAERITWLGRKLRQWSLDELPELVNVLRGDMSLVGPRPLHMNYLNRYTPEQARRHEVNPGITGWAQVNGRNALTWEDRFRLDVWYVEHVALPLDMKILWRTAIALGRADDISHQGHATMPEFRGNPDRGQAP